jgi:3-hydroxy acid dehydrogenase/malonic semialdehyde reductase
VYGATKAFVEQFSLNLRADLAGTGVRVTNIEPGLCGGTYRLFTLFSSPLKRTRENSVPPHNPGSMLVTRTPPLLPEDIANTVAWIASQPPHININRIEMMPTTQSFIIPLQPLLKD